ncbi:MAG: right-handed parallel beta-helix repeat-containing protein [Phycisphaerales bacterium]|jgi:hypothetical protein|nr:right-handed parallel beta-helix repeat-containing protein [Phycisphaerales bacterium]
MACVAAALASVPAARSDVIIIGPDPKTQVQTLTQAAAAANATAFGDVVILVTPALPWPGEGTFTRPVSIMSLTPGINATLVGAATFTEDAEGSSIEEISFNLVVPSTAPRVTAEGAVTLSQCNFNGLPSSPGGTDGGGVHVAANVTVVGCAFSTINTVGDGGGIQAVSGDLTVMDSSFASCAANGGGGGISFRGGGDLVITDCTFAACRAPAERGGGVRADAGTVLLESCSVTDCTAGVDGGGVWIQAADGGAVSNCEFSGTSAEGDGGAAVVRGPVSISSDPPGIVSMSTAGGRGGGVALADGAALSGYDFISNEAGDAGGAVHMSGTNCTIEGGGLMVLSLNESGAAGGAIAADGDGHTIRNLTCEMNTAEAGGGVSVSTGDVTIESVQCVDNTAEEGGGMAAIGGGVLNLTDVILDTNHAAAGGGLLARNRTLDVSGLLALRNTAAADGGGMLLEACEGVVQESTVRTHDIPGQGGGAYVQASDVTLRECLIQDNWAAEAGGGVRIVDGEVAFDGGTIEANISLLEGGGLAAEAEALTMIGTTVAGNGAIWGGGVRCVGGTTMMIEPIILENVAEFGGGVSCAAGEISIVDGKFNNNEAQEDGGGLHMSGFGSADLERTSFIENVGYLRGGNVFSVESQIQMQECELNDGWAEWGGGGYYGLATNLTLGECALSGNMAGDGGGILAANGGRVAALATTIQGNTAMVDGGGMWIGDATPARLDRVVLASNTLSDDFGEEGAAIYGGKRLRISNSLVARHGLGITIRTGGDLIMNTSTVTENAGGVTCDGVIGVADNCIFWSNGGAVVGVSRRYCCFEDGGPDEGNIGDDPLFVFPEAMDYRLQEESPCIDAGKTSLLMEDDLDADGDGVIAEPTPLDLPAADRVVGVEVDMGCVEWPDETGTCPGDLDFDGGVTIDDLLIVIAGWATPEGDVDGDGMTDINDVLLLLGHFGPCE